MSTTKILNRRLSLHRICFYWYYVPFFLLKSYFKIPLSLFSHSWKLFSAPPQFFTIHLHLHILFVIFILLITFLMSILSIVGKFDRFHSDTFPSTTSTTLFKCSYDRDQVTLLTYNPIPVKSGKIRRFSIVILLPKLSD